MARSNLPVILALVTGALIILVAKLRSNRQFIRRLQSAGAPMPKHHPVFGHFIALKESIQAVPRNAVMHVIVRKMAGAFPNGVFYLNLWPFNDPLMVVANPHVASQVENASLDKPANISATLDIINGGPTLMTMHGSPWKKWRALFNLGFAAGYVTELAPAIADEVGVFCNLLQEKAKQNNFFTLEELTLRLTFDIIARVTFGARLHYQTQGSELAD